MAEKIVLPKAFTKEWFSYVWDYYKWHIIICLAVIGLTAFTIYETANTVKYDTNINFIATSVILQEDAEKISDACEEVSLDLDGNGETNISFSQINFTQETTKDANVYTSLISMMMGTFAVEEEYIYIVDEKMMNEIVNMDSTEDLFIPAKKWAGSEDGEYGVSLKNSTVLNENGVDVTDLYIMIRECFNSKDDSLMEKQENAINIAKFLVK